VCDMCLARGHRVVVLDSMLPQIHGEKSAPLPADVEVHVADCRDMEAVRSAANGADVVVHLAALTGVGQSMYEAADYTSVNCVGTAVVMQAVADVGVRRVVLSSSRAVYGEGPHRCENGHGWVPRARSYESLSHGEWEHRCPMCGLPGVPLPADESLAPSTSSVYGATKVAQEQLVSSMGEARGVETAVLRYFNVYGVGQAPNNPYTGILGVFSRAGRAGRASDLFEDGRMLRDFVHVRDVTRATLLACELPLPGGSITVNVASGQPVTIGDLGRIVAELQGASPPVVSGRFRMGDVRHCFANTQRSRELGGFAPDVDLAAGLRGYLDWFNDQELLPVPDATSELEGHGLGGRAKGSFSS
jgi:dTDP-L-rhamnose 4-epimerase